MCLKNTKYNNNTYYNMIHKILKIPQTNLIKTIKYINIQVKRLKNKNEYTLLLSFYSRLVVRQLYLKYNYKL